MRSELTFFPFFLLIPASSLSMFEKESFPLLPREYAPPFFLDAPYRGWFCVASTFSHNLPQRFIPPVISSQCPLGGRAVPQAFNHPPYLSLRASSKFFFRLLEIARPLQVSCQTVGFSFSLAAPLWLFSSTSPPMCGDRDHKLLPFGYIF